MSQITHTDIRSDGWIDRLPRRLRPYALLARLDRPIGTWLLFLPGAWGILLPHAAPGLTPAEDWLGRARLLALFLIGSLVMRSAGCVINDLWDRDIDAQVARTAGRPLASGALRPRQALIFLAGLLTLGLGVLLQLRPACWILGVLVLVPVGLYPLAKRVTWWPQLVMGATFGFGAPMGYVAQSGRFDMAGAALYLATIAWQFGFDTVYGFQDMVDDARIGVKSSSRKLAAVARPAVGVAYAIAIALTLAAGALSDMRVFFYLLMIFPSLRLTMQVRTLDIRDPARCLAQFRQQITVGFDIVLALLIGRL